MDENSTNDEMEFSQHSYGPASVSVSVCACLSRVGVLSKRMDGSGWFLAGRLSSTYRSLQCAVTKFSGVGRVNAGSATLSAYVQEAEQACVCDCSKTVGFLAVPHIFSLVSSRKCSHGVAAL